MHLQSGHLWFGYYSEQLVTACLNKLVFFPCLQAETTAGEHATYNMYKSMFVPQTNRLQLYNSRLNGATILSYQLAVWWPVWDSK